MEVLTFVAELSKLCKDDSTNEDLFGSKCISQRGIVREDLSELIHHIESLEDCIDAVIPANLRFNQVSVGVKEVSKLVQGLDQ